MTSAVTVSEPRLLPRLTALRWWAALAVFLYHLYGLMRWRPLLRFDLGFTGVTFFFVLSGFVLVWAFRGDPSTKRFYQRRFARIYPATLVAGLATAVLLAGGWFGIHSSVHDSGTGVLGAVTSLLLIQAWFTGQYPVYSYNSVSWSLSCEAFFYALLPFLVAAAALRRSRTIAFAAVGSVVVAFAFTIWLHVSGHEGSNIGYVNPLVRLPQFLLGMAIGILVVRGWRPRVPFWLAVLVLLVGVAVGHHWYSLAYIGDYLLLPGYTMLILSCVGADLRGKPGPLTWRFSVYLGELSFCFYLVHKVTMTALMHEFGSSTHHYSLVGGVFLAGPVLIGCAAVAALLHHGVELPAQRRLRPVRSRRPMSSDVSAIAGAETAEPRGPIAAPAIQQP